MSGGITMSDPLDDVLAKIVDEIYNRIGDMNKFDAIGLYDSLEALIKAYGEQCAFNAIHPKCTCSKCTGRPDYYAENSEGSP